ncbi:hypothetical protein NDU88_007328 [Pleurodeles waltl]|uniref:Uncharacterized protein n=1 Tax=Pleurodeles waltl TaxID=8319 RepID=A0AAV7TZR6_PLEWA|nr:hypothetical protein NDU88_007328 [Pleurodeles waltl]
MEAEKRRLCGADDQRGCVLVSVSGWARVRSRPCRVPVFPSYSSGGIIWSASGGGARGDTCVPPSDRQRQPPATRARRRSDRQAPEVTGMTENGLGEKEEIMMPSSCGEIWPPVGPRYTRGRGNSREC